MARIVFDLDGTLIDSAPDLCQVANEVLGQEGLAPITLPQAREFIGNGASVFVAKMRRERGIADCEHDRLLAEFMRRYDDAVELTEPYANVRTSLDTLVSQGHRLGVCTNKPIQPTTSVLKYLGLNGYFLTALGGDSLPVHKPDPAPLHAAFAALGDGPTIYVGDSEIDAETAHRAGVPFLLYANGYRKVPVEDMPHTEAFTDFAHLPDIVANLLKAAA